MRFIISNFQQLFLQGKAIQPVGLAKWHHSSYLHIKWIVPGKEGVVRFKFLNTWAPLSSTLYGFWGDFYALILPQHIQYIIFHQNKTILRYLGVHNPVSLERYPTIGIMPVVLGFFKTNVYSLPRIHKVYTR